MRRNFMTHPAWNDCRDKKQIRDDKSSIQRLYYSSKKGLACHHRWYQIHVSWTCCWSCRCSAPHSGMHSNTCVCVKEWSQQVISESDQWDDPKPIFSLSLLVPESHCSAGNACSTECCLISPPPVLHLILPLLHSWSESGDRMIVIIFFPFLTHDRRIPWLASFRLQSAGTWLTIDSSAFYSLLSHFYFVRQVAWQPALHIKSRWSSDF